MLVTKVHAMRGLRYQRLMMARPPVDAAVEGEGGARDLLGGGRGGMVRPELDKGREGGGGAEREGAAVGDGEREDLWKTGEGERGGAGREDRVGLAEDAQIDLVVGSSGADGAQGIGERGRAGPTRPTGDQDAAARS